MVVGARGPFPGALSPSGTGTEVYKGPSLLNPPVGRSPRSPMHGLTEAEARVVWSALAQPGAPERERLQGSGLPSSTYHATRRRAYEEGWLRDRYVPDPFTIGRSTVSFVLGRPYADETAALVQRWASTDGNAVVWTGTPMVLGVFFHGSPPIARRVISRFADDARVRDLVSLTVDLTETRIPVYFDFEGAWARVAGLPTSSEYPFGLGIGATGPSVPTAGRPLPDRLRNSARELLDRPFVPPEGGLARWLGQGGLDRRQRELFDSGYLHLRTFLDASRLPEYRGRRMDQLVLVTGEMRERRDPTSLLAELRTVHGISPFLFAYEGSRVLLGMMGHSGVVPGSPESGGAPSAPLGSVLRDTLSKRMQRVDVYREESGTVRFPVDHRYSPLLRTPGAEAPAVVRPRLRSAVPA